MSTQRPVRLKDYRPPAYRISEVHLDFDLFESHARVRSRLHFCRAPEAPGTPEGSENPPLILNGEGPVLRGIELDGQSLPPDAFSLDEKTLTLISPPAQGILALDAEIYPRKNTDLVGLYQSGALFCTQNESEGFRRITWFPDRPDVLSVYTVTIRADRESCPVLLSNGSPGETGDLPGGRHFAVWHDPHPKPCYLFALAAGQLEKVSASFKTGTGKTVNIGIFVPPGRSGQTAHALRALQGAMKWDEEHFGFAYDLDTFMIAAVDDFSAGAMENKGLNIFNSAYILADPATATDGELLMIERIIAHEYLHNWTGNRVTCRDWFQLTLKEGLTVYRDEEYISGVIASGGLRIDVVDALKQGQFPEDSGPLAHPIKPDSYLSVDNLYTATVYQKGKEVIRMLECLAGKENFHRGITHYVNKFDGRAVRTEDFLGAVEEACGVDLTLFANWYSRKGTPAVNISGSYSPEAKEYTITAVQEDLAAETDNPLPPLHIPMRLGLLAPDGEDIPLALKHPDPARFSPENSVVHLTQAKESFTFTDVPEPPVPSLFRGFSAPVKALYPYSREDLLLLLEKDSDPYNRWDAGRRVALDTLGRFIAGGPQSDWAADPAVLRAFSRLLDKNRSGSDPGLSARILSHPGIDTLARQHPGYKITKAQKARNFFTALLARFAEEDFISCYRSSSSGPYRYTSKENDRRRLKNTCLAHLVHLGDEYRELAFRQYSESDNMSDTLAALKALSRIRDSRCEEALDDFFNKWKDNALVLDKWFALQAGAESPGVHGLILQLEQHPAFDGKNPNRIRALYGSFAGNLPHFHHRSGSGYTLIADRLLQIDEFNPQAAAGLAKAFSTCPLLDSPRRELMHTEIRRILSRPTLSANVFEILDKTRRSLPEDQPAALGHSLGPSLN